MNDYIEQKKKSHLCFTIGGNDYAINTSSVLEIMKLPALDYPQKLPNNIIGLLKYNNFVINIIDIRFYLDMKVLPYSVNNELIIVKTDEVIFGIITDKIIGILPFDQVLVNQIPYVDNKMIIDSLYKYKERTISIVNIYSLENVLKTHQNVISDVNVSALLPTDPTSEKIMQERTKAIAQKTSLRFAAEELHTKNKYISFNLNNDFYCISLNYVKEVLKDAEITNVPGTPEHIEGIMNVRGDYITVINLKNFLSLPNETNENKRPVIIVNCDGLELAFLIDKINELFDYRENEQKELPDNYYINEFVHNKNLYTALNVEKICSDKKNIVTDI